MSDLSEWYDFALGKHSAIDIKHNNRLHYRFCHMLSERERYADNAMRATFIMGTVLLPGIKALSHVTEIVTKSFEDFWSCWDSIYSSLAASRDISHIHSCFFSKNKNHSKKTPIIKYKHVFSALETFLAVSTTAATIVSAYGLCPLAGPIGVATCMWGSLAKSVHAANVAQKKCDAVFLFYDRLEKLKYAKNKLRMLTGTSGPNNPSLEYCRQSQTVDHLTLEVESIFHNNQDEINNALKEKKGHHLSKLQYDSMLQNIDCLQPSITTVENGADTAIRFNNLSDKDKFIYDNIAKHLKHKQEKKLEERTRESITWGLAAIGMTLIAISVVCPPVALAGIIFSASAGMLKAVELYDDVAGHLEYRHKKIFNDKINTILNNSSNDNQIKAIAHNVFKLKTQVKPTDFTEYWKTMSKSPKKKQRLIRRVVTRHVENNLLLDYLGENQGTTRTEGKTKIQKYINSMSTTDRKHMLKEALQAEHTKQCAKANSQSPTANTNERQQTFATSAIFYSPTGLAEHMNFHDFMSGYCLPGAVGQFGGPFLLGQPSFLSH